MSTILTTQGQSVTRPANARQIRSSFANTNWRWTSIEALLTVSNQAGDAFEPFILDNDEQSDAEIFLFTNGPAAKLAINLTDGAMFHGAFQNLVEGTSAIAGAIDTQPGEYVDYQEDNAEPATAVVGYVYQTGQSSFTPASPVSAFVVAEINAAQIDGIASTLTVVTAAARVAAADYIGLRQIIIDEATWDANAADIATGNAANALSAGRPFIVNLGLANTQAVVVGIHTGFTSPDTPPVPPPAP